MTEYTFFARKAERWGKDMASLWGSLNISPHLNYLELPSHSPGELPSISSLEIWGNIQKPHNDMAYLLVCTGDTLEARKYGISLVWINPNQVRGPPWRRLSEHCQPTSPVDLTGLMPLRNCMRSPAIHLFPRTSIWASYLSERQRRAPMGRSANSKSASSFLPGHE